MLLTTLYIALLVHVLLLTICIWRVWRGENVIDRLMGVDLIGTLTLAILVITAVIQERNLFMDVALGLAALGFVGVMTLAKYIADEQMF